MGLAEYSGHYTHECAAVLGRIYHNALRNVEGPGRYMGPLVEIEPFTLSHAKKTPTPSVAALGDAPAPPWPTDDVLEPELVAEGRRVEKERADLREKIADAARTGGDAPGVDPPRVTGALRANLVADQWADRDLLPLIHRLRPKGSDAGQASDPETTDGISYRVAADRALETPVALPGQTVARWVLVVPAGDAAPGEPWRRFLHRKAHEGPFGGHRLADRTLMLVMRMCWWPVMQKDIDDWAGKCWTCLQFRKRCSKLPQRSITVLCCLPWQHVMCDLEGPSVSKDQRGAAYVFTYACLLCNGNLFEPVVDLRHSQVRAALSRCVFRSGTIPVRISHDRGQEFLSLLMCEMMVLLSMHTRLGTEYRAVEQAPVEREHQELQRELGILAFDIFRSLPGEWASLLPAAEFVRYNTPCVHGLAPRDLDRQWSLASPLERELLPLEPASREPASESAQFTRLRQLVLQSSGREKKRSAELANRFRRSREMREGDVVLCRDPRLSKDKAGRAPWKRPLQRVVVESVSGSRATIRIEPGGHRLEGVHAENLILVKSPDVVEPAGRPRPEQEFIDDNAPVDIETGETFRSPGQMLEHAAAAAGRVAGRVAAAAGPVAPPPEADKARLRGLQIGSYIVYRSTGRRRCRVGRVTQLARLERSVTVHRHGALSDHRLRVRWLLVFYGPDQQETLGAGSGASCETLSYDAVISVVEMHAGGILAHAAARRLDRAGWRMEGAVLERTDSAMALFEDVPVLVRLQCELRLAALTEIVCGAPSKKFDRSEKGFQQMGLRGVR